MIKKHRVCEGVLIDRSRPVRFRFNGHDYTGFVGDTLASALLANGVLVFGRSFKYGRPRGVMTAGVEEPNAIVQVGAMASTETPNVRATQQEIYEGLVARTTNGWPSISFDMMGGLGRAFGRFMPPGFYYKTLMYPRFLWRTYEWFIRHSAGIGQAPSQPDPDRYDKLHRYCDLLIIGAGPAGLSAALTAGKTGARVMLIEDQAYLGGQLAVSDANINKLPSREWLSQTSTQLSLLPTVELLTRTTAVGWHDHNYVVAHERLTDHTADQASDVRQRIHKIRAKAVLLTTGAHERPMVFSNNDLPGCMLASAVSAYLRLYGVRPGSRLVVATSNDSAYQAALDWKASGGDVTVVDARPEPAAIDDMHRKGIKVIPDSVVYEARGRLRVRGVKVASQTISGTLANHHEIACDTFASSAGWSPVVHLASHTGNKPVWDDTLGAFLPPSPPSNARYAGAVKGTYALTDIFNEAQTCVVELLKYLGFESRAEAIAVEAPQLTGIPIFRIPHEKPVSKAPPQFVDYQLDVTAASIELATREGYESVEHIKRYTALGFGTDQGKLSNVNGFAIAANALGKTTAAVGTTMFRPNYTPVSFGAMAGREANTLFDPIRYTAMQPWHEAHGGLFENVGQWKRPWYYPQPGESMQDTLNRECTSVRSGVGILDASTLGKIDIQGPDARVFLNRIYTNAWLKLGVGKCRYGLMCGEDGMVMDDGVTACLADNHFLMTTTTGGAASVLEWLELWHQTEWPELNVYFNTVTDHWATATLSGPKSREVLAKLTDIDLSATAFAFMDWREARVAEIPARVFRISFTGELSYEINVNANYGLTLWERLYEAGAEFDITPYGTETMHILRAEKGFIIVGQDTDGSVTPEDLGMGWAIANKKPFSFIGKRGMQREDCLRKDRKQLVGLLGKDPIRVLPEGGQIVFEDVAKIPADMVGHVTSSYMSPTLGRTFALALVRGGLIRMGETVQVSTGPGTWAAAEITGTVFYDPDGDRQHV